MATINSKKIIDDIIKANGALYDDEPPAIKVVEYTNAWGNVAWGVVWEHEHPSMHDRYDSPTPYIQNPKIIWERK